MNLDGALATFVAESRELLADMETALLAVEQAEARDELVNAIFRAAHTIKGSAGLFGLDHVVHFTHGVESVLDRVRAGELAISGRLQSVLLACRDHVAAQIEQLAGGNTAPQAALERDGEPLLLELRSYLGRPAAGGTTPPPAAAAPAAPTTAGTEAPRDQVASGHWHVSVRFGTGVLRNGMDPLSFIRYLGTMGRLRQVVTLHEAIPPAAQMDPESCYLGFEIALESDADKAAIEAVFDFVRDDCRLRILPPHARIEQYCRSLAEAADPARLGELLVRCGTLTPRELEAALAAQAARPSRPLGVLLAESGLVPEPVVDLALARQKTLREHAATDSRSVRVDADKLDQLINLVGELIIAGANVNAIAQRTRDDDLHESTSKLGLLVEQVRDSALQLRMVKIGATFGRFTRVVHDVSQELGKDIALEISGEDTELDKTVVEKIGDPLTHLVRNAIDHGIEPAGLRTARGKPARGVVRLNAFHDSGSIVITVEDDGGGLDRDRIVARALERGMIADGQALSDAEIHALIFEPGFSTAAQVTNLSGRGVGLDVVKRNLLALRGSVQVDSRPGAGTRVTLRLPLTLAIIDGFLVGVGRSVYALPLDMIEECVAYRAQPGHDYADLRGEVLPLIRLRSLFGQPAAAPVAGENVVVLKHGNERAGVVVDTLLGEFQTVIKPLGPIFGHVKCVSGSTILGSGEVALILDVPALVRQAAGRGNPSPAPTFQPDALPSS